MTNIDRARAAFARWEAGYPTERNDVEHHASVAGRELLDALQACGLDAAETKSLWRGGGRTVHLLCFAGRAETIAVYRDGAEWRYLPRTAFLRAFRPLAGGESA